MLRCYKGRWPEEQVPVESPIWLYYELDVEADNVLRTVEIYQDGHSERNSLALEMRDGWPCITLVHGPFWETVGDWLLAEISNEEFDRFWLQALDKPAPRS